MLTIGFIALFAATFATLVRWLLNDGRIGFLACFAFATGAGPVHQVVIMRDEPLSAFFVVVAFLIVAGCAQGKVSQNGRLILLGIASACCVFAILAKVQALLPLLALPPIAIAFGSTNNPSTSPNSEISWFIIGLSLCAIGIAIQHSTWF